MLTSLSEESPVELGPGGCMVGMGDTVGEISGAGTFGNGPCACGTVISGPAGW